MSIERARLEIDDGIASVKTALGDDDCSIDHRIQPRCRDVISRLPLKDFIKIADPAQVAAGIDAALIA
jgi:hypothetical protein